MSHLHSITILLMLISSRADEDEFNITQEFVDSINEKQNLWVAGIDWTSNKTPALLQALAGTQNPSTYDLGSQSGTNSSYTVRVLDDIPESFDAREHWPMCKSIGTIFDQGYCGSCWAVSTATTVTDRLCIATNGSSQFQFSAEDIITCCNDCSTKNRTGCRQGKAFYAWRFWKTEGVVSGGQVYSNKGCKPYSDVIYHYKGFTKNQHLELPCVRNCTNKKAKINYHRDKRYGHDIYHLANQTVEQIQSEIINNGPVQANMVVFTDFFIYQNGVYFYQNGSELSWHSVVLIGWGEEDGVPYWLCRNSWGEMWGRLKGFFKIRRGTNEVHIEEIIFGGTIKPPVNRTAIETNSFLPNDSTICRILVLVLTFVCQ